MYEFENQLAIGEQDEQELDRFFSVDYEVEPVSMEFQRHGIDRLFTRRDIGTRWSVEYKADYTAARTGNGFIETISVDTAGKKGWAYTSCAQILVYYIPPFKQFHVFQMADIKFALDAWLDVYPVKKVQNGKRGRAEYCTHGVIVPLSEMKRLSIFSGKVTT